MIQTESAGFELKLRTRLVVRQDEEGLAETLRELVTGNPIGNLKNNGHNDLTNCVNEKV